MSFLTELSLKKASIILLISIAVVIGGLLTSTLLTLVVVPVVYSIFEGLRQKLSGGASV